MGPEIQRPPTKHLAPHRRYFPIPSEAPALDAPRGLYDGEPENCRRNLRRFVPILAHLGAMTLVFSVYRVEGRAFLMLATTCLAALPVHYLLPYRWKKPFFVAASIFGLMLVFGAAASAVVLAASAVLIAICYLPIPWLARAGLVGAAAIVLANARMGRIFVDAPETAWPVIGSIFMFRMILYLYELKHAKRREPLVDTLGYFFLLPNFCFVPIFPVVDYRTLQRGYFSKEVHTAQQEGLRMMFRGTVQLLLYRVVYHQWVIGPEKVEGLGTLLQFLTTNYLRYLHVSGQFHVAIGMLGLFGFSLPETHHGYFLATGFTDYWRRINIYWKDFMVRVVFNPVAFRLKRRPQWQTLAAATVSVFVVTWFLHAYQSFWISGSWGFSAQDTLFWAILGGLVLVNVQLDARSPRRRTLGAKVDRGGRALRLRAVKTLATFATIAVLWSLWTSPSVDAWLTMWRRAFS
jgi:alginate O-acetyltransferase complex protein AlgI